MSTLRVFVVDKHPSVREGLRSVLQANEMAKVVGDAATGREAVQMLSTAECDLVLLDINLPDQSGLWCVEQIRERRPELPVLVFSKHTEPTRVLEVMNAGARGYLVKSAPMQDLLIAIQEVANGRQYVHPKVAGALGLSPARRQARGLLGGESPVIAPRERDVLALVVDGLANGEIAERLFLSVSTVKSVIRSLFNRLGVSDRTQLLIRAFREGLLKLE